MQAIEIKGLTKRYKDIIAVSDLSLCVAQGELLALLGVNGAGKTTTVKMLTCLTAPTSGDAFLLGKSILKDKAEVKSIIAVSPQETAVAPALSVKENAGEVCNMLTSALKNVQADDARVRDRASFLCGLKALSLDGGCIG